MSNSPNAAPSRRTEVRHTTSGKTCHHWQYHRLTCDEYDQLRARANGCCEICGTPENETPRRSLVIDHFTRRGRWYVRGLLCDKCNAVMACHDGNKPWGTNRHWELKAREYAANSWQRPANGHAAASAHRAPSAPKLREEIRIAPGKGVATIARQLRRHLTPRQIARLISLLSEEVPRA